MSSKDFKEYEIPSEISQFADSYERILHTGSKVIQGENAWRNGYFSPQDDDYIVLCKDQSQADDLFIAVGEHGWIVSGSMSGDQPSGNGNLNKEHTVLKDGAWSNEHLFVSFKYLFPQVDAVNGELTDYKIPLNLLITCNEEYFDDFTRATFLAQSLELNRKEDRIVLFEAVTRNKWPNVERKEKKDKKVFLKSKYTFFGSDSYGISAAQNLINPPIIGEVGVTQEPDWNTVDPGEATPTTQAQIFWNEANQMPAMQGMAVVNHNNIDNNIWLAEGTI